MRKGFPIINKSGRLHGKLYGEMVALRCKGATATPNKSKRASCVLVVLTP